MLLSDWGEFGTKKRLLIYFAMVYMVIWVICKLVNIQELFGRQELFVVDA